MNERDKEILANLPQILDNILAQILDNILAEHRATNPNPLAGMDVRVEGGPYDGQIHHNTDLWHGDCWEPEIDGVRHRYALGSRIYAATSGRPTEYLWFYQGVVAGG